MSLEARQKWAILARGWKDTGAPAAPSPQDISNYVEPLPRGGGRVLVLGCTPSLRNRLLSESFTPVSVDITREMLEMTTPLVTPAGAELLIQGDWLQLPLSDNSIEAAIGDKVLGNVMPSDWPALFSEVNRVLCSGGAFLTRASPHGEQLLEPPPRRAFGELVNKWVSLQKNGMRLENACSGLWEDCMDMSTERVTPYMGTQQLHRVIPATEKECVREAGADPEAVALVKRFVRNYWSSRHARWSAYTVEAILDAARVHFDFVGTYAASDYPEGDRQPVFHFVRHT